MSTFLWRIVPLILSLINFLHLGDWYFPILIYTISKATVIKTVWCWHRQRRIDQWNRIKNADISQYFYGQLTFKRMSRPCNGLFNKWWWQDCISTYKRLRLDPYIEPFTKKRKNWKWYWSSISEQVPLLSILESASLLLILSLLLDLNDQTWSFP